MKKKILAIDDNDAILDAIEVILQDNGYDVLTRSNGHTLNIDIQKFTPNLIFLDLWLRGENGIEIAKKLKGNKKTSDIPIILISASAHLEEKLSESKADDFIEKPFELADLVKKTRKFT